MPAIHPDDIQHKNIPATGIPIIPGVTGPVTGNPIVPIPKIITTPTTGQTYNPVTPERLAQIAANWQTMSPEARLAAERNQAAAIAAHQRIQARAAQKKEMDISRRDEQRDRIREALALQKRQEREYTRDRREFNRDLTQRQQQRLLQQSTLRTNRADRLKIQRANEKKAMATAAANKKQRDAILRQQRITEHTNKANERTRQAASWRNAVNAGKTNAAADARRFFTDQGANYDTYSGSVDQAIRRIAATLNPGEMPASNTFANVGQDIYDKALNRGRTTAQQTLAPLFGVGFEQRRLPDSAVDKTIQTIQGEQFGKAQDYIDNLLGRGVITQPGYDKALADLQDQSGKVNIQLQDIGNNILEGGRQDLTDISNTAGLAAGNLPLGGTFSPSTYGQQTAAAIKKFQQNLPGAFKTQIQGPLFDTTNLANIAGMASGAQNTTFDPYALQGTARPKDTLFDPSIGMKSVF